MNLKLQWHLRQITKAILTAPMSFSFFLLALCAFRAYQFYRYGLDMYPGIKFPKSHTVQYELFAFWKLSIESVAPWVLVAFPLDVVIRRVGWKLHD